MRPVFRIDLHHLPLRAALCAACALVVLPPGVNAQEPVTASSPDTGSVTLASTTPAAVAAPDREAATAVDNTATTAEDSAAPQGAPASTALNVPADAASVNDLVLDDQALSRQRGGFGGMFMVAATPQLMGGLNSGGNGVTLWDEIAPPSQVPVPVDVARSAQGNVTSYQRN